MAFPWSPGAWRRRRKRPWTWPVEFGFPVVLKTILPQWLHKSDLGGVRLHLGSEAAVSLAFQEMLALFAQRTPKAELQGVLVQKQVKGTELLFGIKLDPQFGPVLVAGMGGIYTEIFQDVARAFAPVNRRMAAAMLQSLRIYPIRSGVWGQAGVALSGLEDIILSLSRLSLDYPEIEEMDLNPVVAGTCKGAGAWTAGWWSEEKSDFREDIRPERGEVENRVRLVPDCPSLGFLTRAPAVTLMLTTCPKGAYDQTRA